MRQAETYVIYGANSFIGSELAKMMLPDVKNLVLFYHERFDRIKDLIGLDKVRVYQSDVRDYEDLVGKMKIVYSEFGIGDLGVVYLPAVRSFDSKALAETSLELSREIVEVNLMGAVHFLKAVTSPLPPPEMRGDLRIVMVGSNVSRSGLKNGSVYAATKAAVANLVKSVAMEVGDRNVLINTVSPGPVETDGKGFSEEYIRFRKEYFETQKALTSLNRVATAGEVCSLIRFLTSTENNHITGEELFVTGGAF